MKQQRIEELERDNNAKQEDINNKINDINAKQQRIEELENDTKAKQEDLNGKQNRIEEQIIIIQMRDQMDNLIRQQEEFTKFLF